MEYWGDNYKKEYDDLKYHLERIRDFHEWLQDVYLDGEVSLNELWEKFEADEVEHNLKDEN